MKRTIVMLFSILISMPLYSQDISGKWNGILKVQGVQLRIIFNIVQKENGYMSTMDSPDQNVKGIPVTYTKFENSTLKLEIPSAGIQFEGTLDKEDIFVGTFTQAGQSFPLTLTKKVEKVKITRPQEPSKPYPYYSENVIIENTTDNILLAGTLTLPKKGGNYPAVILISGSGPQNRDEELSGHKPFLVLADHLTKNGIAVLRFDDRGTGESTGNFKTATSVDFARDVEFAIKYLQKRKEINKSKIGLIGHSEGGIIAPMVAAKSKDIDFIVLLAAPGIRGDKLLLLQQDLVGKASGISDMDLHKAKIINEGAFDIILHSNTYNDNSLRKELTTYFKQALKTYPEFEKLSEMSEDEYVQFQVNRLTNPWMNYFIKYNPALSLENVKCPVLALNGEKDLQVPAKVNLQAIKEALEKGGNTDVTIKELPTLNHLFQECKTGLPGEYAKIEQSFSPLALDEVTNWILKQVK